MMPSPATSARRRIRHRQIDQLDYIKSIDSSDLPSCGGSKGEARKVNISARRPKQRRIPQQPDSRSWFRICKKYAIKHTCAAPLALITCVLCLYSINATSHNPMHPFLFLSYATTPATRIPSSPLTTYGKGPLDLAFLAFLTLVLTFTREFTMQVFLTPLAHHYRVHSRSKRQRFLEQSYTALYFLPISLWGLYLMRNSPLWYFRTRGMYEDYPQHTLTGQFKAYYLIQAASWAQQALVMILGQEAKRKDYKELVVHHVVTLSLIALSYRFHFTEMGLLVFVTHDISDAVLALSKTLHYIDSPLVGPVFASSIVTWIYLRNYQNLRILASIVAEYGTVGSYDLDWEEGQFKCALARVITFGLLVVLQGLNVFWLGYLLRSGYRVAVQGMKKDDRSEEEVYVGEVAERRVEREKVEENTSMRTRNV